MSANSVSPPLGLNLHGRKQTRFGGQRHVATVHMPAFVAAQCLEAEFFGLEHRAVRLPVRKLDRLCVLPQGFDLAEPGSERDLCIRARVLIGEDQYRVCVECVFDRMPCIVVEVDIRDDGAKGRFGGADDGVHRKTPVGLGRL